MDSRMVKVLDVVLTNPNITIRDLILKTSFTRRQVDYSIEKINRILGMKKLPQIVFKRKIGVQISEESRQFLLTEIVDFQRNDFFDSKDNRMLGMLFYIFCSEDYISVDHLTHFFKVSKNTTLSDLQSLESVLMPFGIKIQYTRSRGYQYVGAEINIRSLILKYISQLKENEDYYAYLEKISNMPQIAESIQEIARDLKKQISKSDLSFQVLKVEDIAILMNLIAVRNKNVGAELEKIENKGFELSYSLSEMADSQLKKIMPEYSECERSYGAILIQSILLEPIRMKPNDETMKILYEFTESIINQFSLMARIPTSTFLRFIDKFYLHLQCAYFRLVHRIPITNPMLNEITHRYREFYEIIKVFLQPFEKFIGCKIPPDEIGYIVVHLASYILPDEMSRISRRKALVVSNGGAGMISYYEAQLRSLFPEMLFEFRIQTQSILEMSKQYDLVFSSVALKENLSVPYFYIPGIFSAETRALLIQDVYQQVYRLGHQQRVVDKIMGAVELSAKVHDKKGLEKAIKRIFATEIYSVNRKVEQPLLEGLLSENNIQFIKKVSDWKEAIKIASNPLLEQGSIEECYIDAMIDSVEELGPYIVIVDDIAIPHAKSEYGVNELSISFLKLEEPVFVKEDPKKSARIFFVLATPDSTSHLKALAQLSRMLLDDEAKDKLLTLKTSSELVQIINQFSDEKGGE